ncbi:hypothetical protein K2X89_10305 [Myxococcota bacterium]|nr:hypothetical protein [Myxococcota bacterium]
MPELVFPLADAVAAEAAWDAAPDADSAFSALALDSPLAGALPSRAFAAVGAAFLAGVFAADFAEAAAGLAFFGAFFSSTFSAAFSGLAGASFSRADEAVVFLVAAAAAGGVGLAAGFLAAALAGFAALAFTVGVALATAFLAGAFLGAGAFFLVGLMRLCLSEVSSQGVERSCY